jgi:hypothetical protein
LREPLDAFQHLGMLGRGASAEFDMNQPLLD